MLHENLLYAALTAQRLADQHLGPWRLEDNGAYCLLVADVEKTYVEKTPSGEARTRRKIGEVWIGGDLPGGISGYTTAAMDGDGTPSFTVRIEESETTRPRQLEDYLQNVRGARDLGRDLVAGVAKMVADCEHKLTLVGFHLGLNGDQTTYAFTIPGREGVYTAWQDGETFDHQGQPTTPRYSDGEDASADLVDLTAQTWREWERMQEVYEIPAVIERVAFLVVGAVNS